MASSDHMAGLDQWAQARPPFLEPWFSDLFSRGDGDADAFAEGLPDSLTSHVKPSPFLPGHPGTVPTPAVSGVSASSDPEPAPKRRNNPIPPAASTPRGGKVSKRKSRASKRSQTTFISADAANFRQMVQQVTGVRFGGPHGPLLKPEPLRAGAGRLLQPGEAASGWLPNLSAMARRQNSGGAVGLVAAPAAGDSTMNGFLSFDSSSSVGGFPTLESWKAI